MICFCSDFWIVCWPKPLKRGESAELFSVSVKPSFPDVSFLLLSFINVINFYKRSIAWETSGVKRWECPEFYKFSFTLLVGVLHNSRLQSSMPHLIFLQYSFTLLAGVLHNSRLPSSMPHLNFFYAVGSSQQSLTTRDPQHLFWQQQGIKRMNKSWKQNQPGQWTLCKTKQAPKLRHKDCSKTLYLKSCQI